MKKIIAVIVMLSLLVASPGFSAAGKPNLKLLKNPPKPGKITFR